MNIKTLANLVFVVITVLTVSKLSLSQSRTAADELVYGKYGCTASKFNGSSIEYTPRGSFSVSRGGKYTYQAFEKPSAGTFSVDDKGNLTFRGGYLDHGVATKIDRPNKFFLVFPTIPDNRWTCGLIDK